MWRAIVVLMAATFVAASSTGDQKYFGPKCLGPFCNDHFEAGASLFGRLGSPSGRADLYCYHSRDGAAFLRIGMIATDPGRRVVGDIFLSDFVNCIHMPKPVDQVTANDLREWKTREGIGLGSSEQSVVKAYGRPTSERKVDSKVYRHIIMGYRPQDNVPNVGEKIMEYTSKDENDGRSAEFGIRDGKVAWIALSA